MQLHYFLPVLAIFMPGGATLESDSKIATFAKLCFLPTSPEPFFLKSLVKSEQPSEKLYAVIGNDVIQQKTVEFLTEKKEKRSEEDLTKLCLQANVESVDDDGVSLGKYYGFQKSSFNYTCKDSQDFPGILRCHLASSSKLFEEEALSYFSIAKEDFIFEIDCFKTGEVGWILYSTAPKISEEDKKFYYAHAASLGFPEKSNVVMYDDHCVV